MSCETCQGTGAKPGTKPQTCDYCGGRGRVMHSQGFFRVQTTCPGCHGAGRVIRERCGDCSGSGLQLRPAKLEVKVPGGVDNGMQLCLRGEGEAGPGGGPAGDLYVDIQVRPHPFFERHETQPVVPRSGLVYAGDSREPRLKSRCSTAGND